MSVDPEEITRLWETISTIQNSITNLSNIMQETLSNKSTNVGADSLSDTKYPTVKAVKTFVSSYARNMNVRLTAEEATRASEDNNIAIYIANETNRAIASESLKENTANKSSSTSLGTSDVLFPTQNAVKTYVDSFIGTSSTGIVAEVTRATAAEATLTTTLANEVTRATAAEATLTTNLALKEILANKSTSIDVDATSDVKYPSVKAVKIYVDTVNKEVDLIAAEALIRAAADVNVQSILNTSITSEATTRANADTALATNLTAEVTRATATEALKEILANKSIDVTTDGASDDKYPSVKAVKTYVDTSAGALSTNLTTEVTRATSAENTLTANLTAEVNRATAAEATLTTSLTAEVTRATAVEASKEILASKSINVATDGTSDIKYPSVKAVKTYVDTSTSALATNLTTEMNRAIAAEALKENSANKSTATTLGTSDTLFPSQNAVKTYVDNVAANIVVADATATVKGKIQLSGDLGGTAAAPSVPGLALKENTANKSTATTLGTSDTLFPTQNAVKTYVDAETSRATAIEALKEILANKSINVTTDGASDTKYPSVKAVKTYVDAETTRATAAEALKENTANKSTTTTLGTSDVLFPTQNAVKTYVDAETSRATAIEALKEILANKSINVTTDGASDTKYPSVKAVKTYVDAETTRATAAEALKENTANKSTTTTLGTSDVLFPTQNAVKTYVDAETSRATAIEALKEILANKSINVTTDGASDTKYPSVKAVKTYVDASTGAVSTSLTAEVTRATTAEGTLTTNLTAEVTRATAAEGTLTTNLTAEVTRATTAEGTLTTNLTAEVTRATAAEALKENTANKSTSIALGTSDVLFPTQNAVKVYVDAASSASTTALASEATTRATADTTLTTNIANEVTRATATEATLTTNLTAEVTRATAAEATLTTNLAAEVTRATGAEALKEDAANKSTTVTLGTSDVLFPTQNAVKTYVDTAIAAIPSDYRIKTDVQTLDSAYTIDNIRPVTYINTLKNKQEIGVIAHELQAIYPCLVNGEKDGETLQTVNYNGLFGILINEIQMLKQKINEMSV